MPNTMIEAKTETALLIVIVGMITNPSLFFFVVGGDCYRIAA